MSTESNTLPTVRWHMTRVAEKIDAHLGEQFAMELNREFEHGCCVACRVRIEGPVPRDADVPERDAERLMRMAAQTKKCVPARDRWRLEPELKLNLAALYRLYQRGMIGVCSSLIEEWQTPAVTVARFRDDFLRRCIESDIYGINDALELLKEQEKTYATDWLN